MLSDIILNGAIGDAFGSYYEGREGPCAYEEHDEWILTDDTALTLATCEAIIESESIIPSQIASNFVEYFNRGEVIRAGSSTVKALIELSAGIDHRSSGRKGEMAAGNGVAMRIAPLASCIDLQDYDSRKLVREVSYITHQSEEAYSAGIAIIAAIQNPSDPVTAAYEATLDSDTKDKLGELLELNCPIGKAMQLTGVSGYSASSVPLAIYGAKVAQEIGFQRAIIELCCCGGDADTIASMSAQIMGAAGLKALKEWINKLPQFDRISEIANSWSAISHTR